jgi:hypothetical protein
MKRRVAIKITKYFQNWRVRGEIEFHQANNVHSNPSLSILYLIRFN